VERAAAGAQAWLTPAPRVYVLPTGCGRSRRAFRPDFRADICCLTWSRSRAAWLKQAADLPLLSLHAVSSSAAIFEHGRLSNAHIIILT